jgi:hypothetical protein
MCEEFPRYSAPGQKPEFDRRVVRVITPGTLIDESFINQFENNYLLSISADGTMEEMDATPIGLAWIDVSTGEFFAKTSSREALKDDLARICPREVVLEDKFQANFSHPIHHLLVDEGCFISYATPSQSTLVKDSPETAAAPDDLDKLERGLTSVPSAYSHEESSAITILTIFLNAHLLEHMPSLSIPSREGNVDRMQIDSHTIKALEIRESTREGGTTGSLLSVVKRTVTRSGTRLLARWLCKYLLFDGITTPLTHTQVHRAHQSKKYKLDSHWWHSFMQGHTYSAMSGSSWMKSKTRHGSFRGSFLGEVILAIWFRSARRLTFGVQSTSAWNSRSEWKVRNKAFCFRKIGQVSMLFYVEWQICKTLSVESIWLCEILKLQMSREMIRTPMALCQQTWRSPAKLVPSLIFPLGVSFDRSTQRCRSKPSLLMFRGLDFLHN